MSDPIISFTDEPYAVRLLPQNVPLAQAEEQETDEVCPLLAVHGDMGLVVRNREMFWYPLERVRVVLQPKVEEAHEVQQDPNMTIVDSMSRCVCGRPIAEVGPIPDRHWVHIDDGG